MSILGVLGDIHGNLEALTAVLADARSQGVTGFVCVGDIVGYNASPAECLEIVRDLDGISVRGNHDHYCSHDEDLRHFHPLAAAVMSWTRQRLSAEQKEWLRQLRYVQLVDDFALVHATLDMPQKWGYVFDELDARANFTYQTAAVCFHGHTHVPIVFEDSRGIRTDLEDRVRVVFGRKYFVNVGSVGQPRNGDPRACYVLYDSDNSEIRYRRVDYDLRTAQEKIVAAGLPTWMAERLALGK